MGSPGQNEAFWNRYWPEARAILDPHQKLYEAFDVGTGSLGQFLGPRLWWKYLKAIPSGMGWPRGNTMRNPGACLIEGNTIVARQEFADFGTMVDTRAFVALATESTGD